MRKRKLKTQVARCLLPLCGALAFIAVVLVCPVVLGLYIHLSAPWAFALVLSSFVMLIVTDPHLFEVKVEPGAGLLMVLFIFALLLGASRMAVIYAIF